MTYAVTAAVCVALLALLPLLSGRGGDEAYPLAAVVLLAAPAILVPLPVRRRRKDEDQG